MVDIDPFLTFLSVMGDDFCKHSWAPQAPRSGPAAWLTQTAVVTLALFAQWQPFGRAPGFYRYPQRPLRSAFPTVPERRQFKRLWPEHKEAIVACFLHLVQCRAAQRCGYEALDPTAVPTRAVNRRGLGWLPGLAAIGWSPRLGGDEGFQVLLSVNPVGVVSGFGFAAGSTQDQPLADPCFAVRHTPHPGLASGGAPAQGVYVTDTGFEGPARHQHWQDSYGAVVLCAPKPHSRSPWSRPWRRWLAGLRQIVDPVNASLQQRVRLERERPHTLEGVQVRRAAKRALHNCCIWLNLQLGRPRLAFADLVAW